MTPISDSFSNCPFNAATWTIAIPRHIVHLCWYATQANPDAPDPAAVGGLVSRRGDENSSAPGLIGRGGASGRNGAGRRAAENGAGLAYLLEKLRRFGRAHENRLATGGRNQGGRNPMAGSGKTHRRRPHNLCFPGRSVADCAADAGGQRSGRPERVESPGVVAGV